MAATFDIRKAERLSTQLCAWFEREARSLPWRETTDPYGIWVSEIMLQQTQVTTVVSYWIRWMTRFPDVFALANASLPEVLKLWEGLGYYSRARNLHLAAQVVARDLQGRLPDSVEGLLSLPGIGRYTAGAIASIAFDEPVPILDGNVVRVLSRIHALEGFPTNSFLWELAGLWSEAARRRALRPSVFNQSLMELGATVCTPKNPRCLECPVRKGCKAFALKTPEAFPPPRKRPEAIRRFFKGVVVSHRGRFLVQQRPAEGINGGLWEFPHVEVGSAPDRFERYLRQRRLSLLSEHPLCTVRHSITRYRNDLVMYRARTNQPGILEGEWKDLDALQTLPFSGSQAKVLKVLLRNIDSPTSH